VGEELSIRKAANRPTALCVLTEHYWNHRWSSSMLLPKSEVGTSISSLDGQHHQGWVPEGAASLAKLADVELCWLEASYCCYSAS